MRVLSLFVAVMIFGGVAIAQDGPSHQSGGTLAQMMRAIFFVNSNVLFDVQSTDPGAPKEVGEHGTTATERFGSLYDGWQVVDASAVALAEAANLLVLPGRVCQNGRLAPVDRPDWIQYAKQMEDAGKAAVEAAKTRNQAAVSDVTNEVVGACCHRVYRDTPGGEPDRCR